jgi:hypothetical protein
MNAKNIPHHEKFNALVEGLTELEPLALDLSRDAVHCTSPHIAPLVGRIRGAIESLRWHATFLAAQPDTNPQPSTTSDAKAGDENRP